MHKNLQFYNVILFCYDKAKLEQGAIRSGGRSFSFLSSCPPLFDLDIANARQPAGRFCAYTWAISQSYISWRAGSERGKTFSSSIWLFS